MTEPVFIVGVAPRSGTNYVEDLLCVHEDCGLGIPLREDHLLDHADHLERYVDEVTTSWLRLYCGEAVPASPRRGTMSAWPCSMATCTYSEDEIARAALAPTTTTVWRLTTPTGAWEVRAAMPVSRRAFVVGTANGDAQLFGGENATTAAITSAVEYDPDTNTWTNLTSLPSGRHGPSGATINGITYVAGGATTTGANSSTTVNQAFTR